MEGLAAQNLIDAERRQRDNILAEDAAVRKTMGWPEPSSVDGSDGDMERQTIIGDVTHAPPVVVTQAGSGSSLGAVLLAAVLGAAIPGAGIGGALLSRWMTQPVKATQSEAPATVKTFEDQTVELGLDKIEESPKLEESTKP